MDKHKEKEDQIFQDKWGVYFGITACAINYFIAKEIVISGNILSQFGIFFLGATFSISAYYVLAKGKSEKSRKYLMMGLSTMLMIGMAVVIAIRDI